MNLNLRRGKIDNKWWTYDLKLFKWTESHSGEAVVIYWYEVDGGPYIKEIKLSAGFNTKEGIKVEASTTFNIGKKDDDIGHLLVLMSDCPSELEYSLGSIKWKTKVKDN